MLHYLFVCLFTANLYKGMNPPPPPHSTRFCSIAIPLVAPSFQDPKTTPHHIMTSKQTTIANDFCTVYVYKAKNPAGATPLSHPALRALISKCFKVDFKSNDGSVAAELGKKFAITQAKNRAEADAAKGVYSLRISGNGGAVKETVFGGLVLRKLPGISDAAKKTEAYKRLALVVREGASLGDMDMACLYTSIVNEGTGTAAAKGVIKRGPRASVWPIITVMGEKMTPGGKVHRIFIENGCTVFCTDPTLQGHKLSFALKRERLAIGASIGVVDGTYDVPSTLSLDSTRETSVMVQVGITRVDIPVGAPNALSVKMDGASWMSVFGEDEVPEEAPEDPEETLAEASDTEANKEDSEESVQWH